MIIFGIRNLFFSFLMIAFSLLAKAQQSHFVYLQTDNGQPFYTKFNGKLISSSAAGYVILPGIADGDYQLTVGFPKNELPEETFKINIDKNNEGYLIKNFDEKGLQLFNLQTLALIEGTGNNTIAANTPKNEDAFSIALAGAVKDSSILQNHEGALITPAIPVAVGTAAVIPSKKNSASDGGPVAQSAMVAGDSVSKIMSTQNEEGLQMVYEDKTDSSTDTVRLLIPVEKKQSDSGDISKAVTQNYPSTKEASSAAAPAVVASGAIVATAPDENKGREENSRKQDSVAINETKGISSADTSVSIQPAIQADTVVHDLSKTQVIVLPKEVTSSKNSDCKAFATDNDFLKLRGKMAEESDNNKMIKVATKYFQKKCYSTAQIKNLSYIFLTNEAKYQFLEVAYPFVSDADQYPALESQFTDDYYLNRFKALTSK
jgi:hypothetical protein